MVHLLLFMLHLPLASVFFFFNDTATTEIYTLSLHDALPIWEGYFCLTSALVGAAWGLTVMLLYPEHGQFHEILDRKSTRLNSSHVRISYAVFCLKKKKNYTFPLFIQLLLHNQRDRASPRLKL